VRKGRKTKDGGWKARGEEGTEDERRRVEDER